MDASTSGSDGRPMGCWDLAPIALAFALVASSCAGDDGDSTSATTRPSDAPGAGVAAPSPDPAAIFVEIGTFDQPVDMAWRVGDEGLYVVERDGRVVRLDGDGDATTVLDITDITMSVGERGLLGLAFSPVDDLAYVNYTDRDGRTIIAEYPVAGDGTFLTGDFPRLLMDIEQPHGNHNGGDLTFGPDGMLYIGLGDGGSAGDPGRRATDLSSLLGKILRIDPTPSEGRPYTVPADNPFVGDEEAAPEVWTSGLRNPWRFSFDRATGDLWIGDVGQDEVEEVDVAAATGGVDAGKGLSFGWSAFEGDNRFNEDVPADGHVGPFTTYERDQGCSISGGVRARGEAVGAMAGWYVFGDWCSGHVWALEVNSEGPSLAPGRMVVIGEIGGLTAIVDGPRGELYALSQTGPAFRIDAA